MPRGLTYLSLGSNHLESLEALRDSHLPHLRTLKLYDNRLTTIKSLRKVLSRNLGEVSLCKASLIIKKTTCMCKS